jgi:phage-related baseplate assembly protein
MRFAGIKELKHKTMDIIRLSEKGDIIITAYGKPTAILHHITEDDLADYLIENDPAFRKRVEEAYREYSVAGGMTADALMRILEKARGNKSKRV